MSRGDGGVGADLGPRLGPPLFSLEALNLPRSWADVRAILGLTLLYWCVYCAAELCIACACAATRWWRRARAAAAATQQHSE